MKYSWYKPSDTEAIVAALNQCFPEKKISNQSFIWKHFAPFFENKTKCRIAWHEGKCVSVVCFTPQLLSIFGQEKTVYSCAVQATVLEFRRQGLVSKLTQEIEESLPPETDFLGFSNTSGLKIDTHSKRIAYHIVGRFVTTYLPSFLKDDMYNIELETVANNNLVMGKNGNVIEYGVSDEYLLWRFINHPKRRYSKYKILSGRKILGYFFSYVDSQSVNITKLVLDTDKICPELLSTIAHHLWQNYHKAVSITYLKNAFWQRKIPLLSLTKPENIHLTVKANNSELKNANNWMLMGGDIQ